MSALAIRRTTRRLRRHTAGVLVVLVLGAVIAMHDSAVVSVDAHHAGMGAVLELCVGVFTAAGVAAAIAVALRRLGRWDTPAGVLPLGVRLVAWRARLEPRAGPPAPSLLSIWRR